MRKLRQSLFSINRMVQLVLKVNRMGGMVQLGPKVGTVVGVIVVTESAHAVGHVSDDNDDSEDRNDGNDERDERDDNDDSEDNEDNGGSDDSEDNGDSVDNVDCDNSGHCNGRV